jgi:hypothetical protein
VLGARSLMKKGDMAYKSLKEKGKIQVNSNLRK